VASLCEALRESVRRDEAGIRVNLLLDRETEDARVESPYTRDALRVTVFSPEDIGVVRAGPADRRRFLDETLAVVDPNKKTTDNLTPIQRFQQKSKDRWNPQK